MRFIHWINEVVGLYADSKQTLFAKAEIFHEPETKKAEVRLHAWVRPTSTTEGFLMQRPAWLPEDETVHEHMEREEVDEWGREVFFGWTKKVRESVPADLGFRHS